MSYKATYESWLEQEKNISSKERQRRLKNGLGTAESTFLENVWWPLMGDFCHLHPEYEVTDYSGAGRFLDFAYLRGGIKLAIEIDGFTTHAKNINRHQFSYQLHRQNVLTVDGWDILRFAYDDTADHPRRCQRTIQQYMGSRFATSLHTPGSTPRITAIDREVVRLARSLPHPLSPKDVQQHLSISRTTAYHHIRRLVARGWLIPASGTMRIRTYELAEVLRHQSV